MERIATKSSFAAPYANAGNLTFQKVYSVIILLLPILMIFKIPVFDVGLSTLLVIALVPYPLYYLIRPIRKANILVAVFAFGLFIYLIARSLNTPKAVILYICCLIHILGFINGSLCFESMRKSLEVICLLLSVLVVIQTIAFYLFGVRFTYLIEELIIPEKQYVVTSFYIDGGSFRPSAIFLEPAHYAQFVCVGLLSCLYPIRGKTKWVRSFVLAVGVLLTTSGIGLLMMALLFVSKPIFSSKNIKSFLMSLIGLGAVLAVSFVILRNFAFFNFAIDRIFGEYTNGNAIWGRTVKFVEYILPMQGIDLIVGYGGGSRPANVYMTGFMELIYCFGYLGLALYLFVFFLFAFKSRSAFSFVLFLFYVGLMLAADVIGFMNILFFSSLLIGTKNRGLTQ